MLREEDHAYPEWIDMSWHADAACADMEVEESDRLFFCGQGQARLANQAREICAVCIVRAECLAFALENPEASEYGIWGGLSPSQRRRLRGLAR
jgi:WhiB family transcriptional regulator, redox-sensing transcriptional regulator